LISYLSQHFENFILIVKYWWFILAEFSTLLVLGLQRSCNKHLHKSILWSRSLYSNRELMFILSTTKNIYVHCRKLEFLYSYFIFSCPKYFIHSFIYHQKYLIGSLTKPLLLLLLSKDCYYKKLSIVAAILILYWWTVFAFNTISRYQRDMRRIRMERI